MPFPEPPPKCSALPRLRRVRRPLPAEHRRPPVRRAAAGGAGSVVHCAWASAERSAQRLRRRIATAAPLPPSGAQWRAGPGGGCQGCSRREGTSEAGPEAVRQAVGGGFQNKTKRSDGYCRLQMPWKSALAVRETVAGHRLGALEGGGGGTSPPSNAPLRAVPQGEGGGYTCPRGLGGQATPVGHRRSVVRGRPNVGGHRPGTAGPPVLERTIP